MGPSGSAGSAGAGGDDDSGGPDGDPQPQCMPPLTRVWKLTPRQYDASLEQVLPGAASAELDDLDEAERSFTNEADHNDLPLGMVRSMFHHAERQAQRVTDDPGMLDACLASFDLSDDACLRGALDRLLQRAHRRPADAAEVDELVDFVHEQATAHGPAAALGQAVHAVLTSPSFLFRTELGPVDAPADADTLVLDDHEIASALSYLLLDGPPDAALLAAAKTGGLADPDVRAEHARRLLEATGGSQGLREFFTDYTQTRQVAGITRNPSEYADFNEQALAEQMGEELRAFVTHVITEDDARLHTLLTASYSVVSPALAQLYGVEPAGEGWARVELPADQRAGLLTNPAMLLMGSKYDHGDPVSRGLYIRNRLLCQELPPPPPDIPPLPSSEGHTQRELLAQHAEDQYCRSCHQLMDPLGLPLEHYDAIGRFRETDHGHEIDASGAIYDLGEDGEEVVHVDDALELAEQLAVRPEVRSCFVQSMFHYAYGRLPAATDDCELQRLEASFSDSDGDIVELVVALVSSDHFITRRRTTP